MPPGPVPLGTQRSHDFQHRRMQVGRPVGARVAQRIEAADADHAAVAVVKLKRFIPLGARRRRQAVGLVGRFLQLAGGRGIGLDELGCLVGLHISPVNMAT